jgi:CO/xanthine dehydrogenase Mo-binding subunit
MSQRREFLRTAIGLGMGVGVGAAFGGGLLIGFSGPAKAAGSFNPNAFIRIDPTGLITLIMPKVEMGQGTHTANAMLLAEELEVGLDQIRLQESPPDDALYGDPLNDGIQMTGTSTAMRYGWEPLRHAGALARLLLINAAARRWGTDPASCQARRGTVVHPGSGRALRFAELTADAVREPIPAVVPLKDPLEFKLIGTSAKRLDTPGKLDGGAQYGIDARIPGMKFAAVTSCPVFGGMLTGVDERAALAVHAVRTIVRLDDAVAVVADDTWSAFKGLAALRPTWNFGANASVSSASLWRELQAASAGPAALARNDGDAQRSLLESTHRVEASYRQPFLAHAAMEPMNCTVHVDSQGCQVWVGTQVPSMAQAAVAKLLALPASNVQIHNHLIGGGFGRRLEVDGILLAARIAQRLTHPVKVVWSREEDLKREFYRPMYLDQLSAGLDVAGRPTSWSHRICGSAVTARYAPADMKDGVDPDAVEGAIDSPYDLANIRVEFVQREPRAIPTGWWRGVGPTRSTFVVESFIDELSAVAKTDPVAYRRSLLGKSPRARAVLDLAAHESGWGKPLPAGQGRGVSLMSGFGSFLCCVAEVEVGSDRSVKVGRVVCAVDCGVTVNPRIVSAQIEGGIVFGLSAALFGEITIRDGRVEQGNFNDYRVLRMGEAPLIDVHLVKSSELPGGIGETGTAVVAAAVANGVFAACGHRVRELPIHLKA